MCREACPAQSTRILPAARLSVLFPRAAATARINVWSVSAAPSRFPAWQRVHERRRKRQHQHAAWPAAGSRTSTPATRKLSPHPFLGEQDPQVAILGRRKRSEGSRCGDSRGRLQTDAAGSFDSHLRRAQDDDGMPTRCVEACQTRPLPVRLRERAIIPIDCCIATSWELRARTRGRAARVQRAHDKLSFLGGTGAGAPRRPVRARVRRPRCAPVARAGQPPEEFFAQAWPVCAVTLATGMLCLLMRLAQNDRLLDPCSPRRRRRLWPAAGSFALV